MTGSYIPASKIKPNSNNAMKTTLQAVGDVRIANVMVLQYLRIDLEAWVVIADTSC